MAPPGVIAMQIASALSIVSALFVMITIVRLKLYNKIFLKMVFFVALSDCLAACATVVGGTRSGSVECYLQGIISNFFELSSFFWSAAICYEVWMVVIHSKIQKEFFLIHLVCWISPAIFTFLPLINEKYDNDDVTPGWCFLSHQNQASRDIKDQELFWFLFAFYLWLWLVFFYMLYSLISVSYKLFIDQRGQNDASLIVVKRMSCYPLIIIICWTVPSILDMMSFQSDDDLETVGNSYIAILCAYILPNIQGFLTAVAFSTVNKDLVTEVIRVSFGSRNRSINNPYGGNVEDLSSEATSLDKGYRVSALWSSTDQGSSSGMYSGQHERLLNEDDIEDSHLVKVTVYSSVSPSIDDNGSAKHSDFSAAHRPFLASDSSSQDGGSAVGGGGGNRGVSVETTSTIHTYASAGSSSQISTIQGDYYNHHYNNMNMNNNNNNNNFRQMSSIDMSMKSSSTRSKGSSSSKTSSERFRQGIDSRTLIANGELRGQGWMSANYGDNDDDEVLNNTAYNDREGFLGLDS